MAPKKSGSAASVDRNIKVVVRVRADQTAPAEAEAPLGISRGTVRVATAGEEPKSFTFDHVLGGSSTQEDVFSLIGTPVIKNAIEGFHGTILVYGQTGSGKTHTMIGPDGGKPTCLDESNPVYPQRGLIPRIGAALFDELKTTAGTWDLMASFYEIYQEKVRDLMEPSGKALQVIGDKANVRIQSLSTVPLTTAKDLLDILRAGSKHRAKRATDSNEYSSRSHAILQLLLRQKLRDGRELFSKMNLVDLAGSERVSKTHATGQGLQEGCTINLSLSALGQVIHQLCKSHEHVSFRNSILTRVLQDSLGGTAITTLVCAVSPLLVNLPETLSTLVFANYAKEIKNHATQNVVLSATELQARLDAALEENERLRREIEEKKRRQEKDTLAFSVAVGLGAKSVALGGSLGDSKSLGVSAALGAAGCGNPAALMQEIEERNRKEEELRQALIDAEERVRERDVEGARLKEEAHHWQSMYEKLKEAYNELDERAKQDRALVLELKATNEEIVAQLAAARQAQQESAAVASAAAQQYGQRLAELREVTDVERQHQATTASMNDQLMALQAESSAKQGALQSLKDKHADEIAALQRQLKEQQQTIHNQHATITAQTASVRAAEVREAAALKKFQLQRDAWEELQIQASGFQRDAARSQAELEILQSKHTNAMADCADLRQKLQDLEVVNAETTERMLELQHVEAKAQRIEETAKALQGQHSDKEKAVMMLRSQLETVQSQLEMQMRKETETNRKIQASNETVREISAKLENTEEQVVSLTEAKMDLEARTIELEQQLVVTQKQLRDRIESETAHTEANDNALKKVLHEREELQAQVHAREEELRQLRTDFAAKADVQVATVQAELAHERVRFQKATCDLQDRCEEEIAQRKAAEARAKDWHQQFISSEARIEDLEQKLDTALEEKDKAALRAEAYRSGLIEKDTEIDELRAALKATARLVEASRLTAGEKIAILQAAKAQLQQELGALEALAKKLYNESVQHEFVTLVEETLSIRNEEVMTYRLRQASITSTCIESVGDPYADPSLRVAVVDVHDFWRQMYADLLRIGELCERTQFIDPSDESQRVSLVVAVHDTCSQVQDLQRELVLISGIAPDGLRARGNRDIARNYDSMKHVLLD
eukprot:TRINITY_DN14415_c0_g1_i1.p1 TRINITY_DN14415_c0_g1~~TRINITY_DN14415_c0_g1_i1.p1  ORF type:complete len:1131 (-),score=250.22 TRINITY_DN14415_c0_g1_i1:17-3409(-)